MPLPNSDPVPKISHPVKELFVNLVNVEAHSWVMIYYIEKDVACFLDKQFGV